ncbi:MAG: DNA polymerase III subunit delta [Brevinematia bacterium]
MKAQRRQTKGIFLLLGENEVDKEVFLEKIIKEFSANKNVETIHIDAKEEGYLDKFVNTYSTPSLFVPHRVIVVKNLEGFTKSEKEVFIKIIKEFKDDKTLLIFISSFSPYKFDRQISSFVEQVGGEVKVFWKVSEQSLKDYTKDILSRSGIEVSEELVSLLIERNGRNVNAIVEEVNYVKNYFSNVGFISSKDAIELIYLRSGEGNIFDLINAILLQDKHTAILLIDQIFERGEDIFALGSLLYSQISKIIKIKKLTQKPISDNEVCERLGISQFEFKNLKRFLSFIDDKKVKSLLRLVVAIEEVIRVSDNTLKIAKLENYILRYL